MLRAGAGSDGDTGGAGCGGTDEAATRDRCEIVRRDEAAVGHIVRVDPGLGRASSDSASGDDACEEVGTGHSS
jgi:hypothetical protein